MNNVYIFRFVNGLNVIGERIHKPDSRKSEWERSIWIKKARVIAPQPSAQPGVVNIGLPRIGQIPADIGVEESDHIKEFNKDAIYHIDQPDQKRLSQYMAETIGIALPTGAEMPKEMRQ